jgi:hypothetical protein
VTALQAAGVSSGFRLVLHFGTVHGLTRGQREAVNSEGQRGHRRRRQLADVRRGAEGPTAARRRREEIAATYRGWNVIDDNAFDVSQTPGPFKKANRRWYRLRRD